jgi:hypothetical protein
LLAACSGGHRRGGPSGSARLVVKQVREPGPLPVEGAYSYARVERDASKVVQVRLPPALTPHTTIRLDAGSYRLVSFQRHCNGNCHLLGPPTDECSRGFSVRAGESLRALVRIRFGSGCRISFVRPK